MSTPAPVSEYAPLWAAQRRARRRRQGLQVLGAVVLAALVIVVFWIGLRWLGEQLQIMASGAEVVSAQVDSGAIRMNPDERDLVRLLSH